MDYTQSNSFVVDASTGFNRHEDNSAVPTAVTEKDMNQPIWSLMEVVKAGGHVGVQFDETAPATYKLLIKAMRAAFGGNVTTLNLANSPLVLTKDNAGLVLVDATAGHVSATLPAANVLAQPVKLRFVRVDATGNTATITCAGADTLIGGAVSFTLTGLTDQRFLESSTAALWLINAQQVTAYKNLPSLTVTVAANAMTGTLGAESLDFRSVTLTSGVPVTRTAAGAVALVVPSGAELGAVANVANRIVWGWIDSAGTLEPFVCNLSGGLNLDETTLISTIAISAAADAANVFYSTTARANVAFRVRGFCDIAQVVPGTHATAPTLVQGAGGLAAHVLSGAGYGEYTTVAKSQGVTYYTGPYERIVSIMGSTGSTTDEFFATIKGTLRVRGGYAGTSLYSTMSIFFVVPAWTYYSVSSTSGSVSTWSETR